MHKVVYVIPAYSESTKYKRYKKILPLFMSRGFEVIPVKIKWKNNTMTDYVNQFLKNYKPKKDSYLFGFSFGAMITLISARKVKPKMLILCSLSPYFKEDLPAVKQIFGKPLKKYFKKRDFEDLEKYSFNKIAKNVKCETILIAGDREVVIRRKNYPIVLNRSKEAKKKIKYSKLVVVKNGKHDISQKVYLNAIKKILYKL